MKLTTLTILAFTFVVAATGCDRSTTGSAANQKADPAMPAMKQPASSPATPAPAQHMATGTLNAIDRDAGTVNISHGAVATANWPAMTMSFKLADPKAAADLLPGQRVDFQFTIEGGMSATVTKITRAE